MDDDGCALHAPNSAHPHPVPATAEPFAAPTLPPVGERETGLHPAMVALNDLLMHIEDMPWSDEIRACFDLLTKEVRSLASRPSPAPSGERGESNATPNPNEV